MSSRELTTLRDLDGNLWVSREDYAALERQLEEERRETKYWKDVAQRTEVDNVKRTFATPPPVSDEQNAEIIAILTDAIGAATEGSPVASERAIEMAACEAAKKIRAALQEDKPCQQE